MLILASRTIRPLSPRFPVLRPVGALTADHRTHPQSRHLLSSFQDVSLLTTRPRHGSKRTAAVQPTRSLAVMASLAGDIFFLDEFAFRQFDGGHAAEIDYDKAEFVRKVHGLYTEGDLVDGYAPFCKHVFVPNFTNATLNALPISDQNRHHLQSGYSRRRPDELPVLSRWFPKDKVSTRPAKFLDLILYSREQLVKEHDAMPGKGPSDQLPKAPWGIISIKPQDEDYETPMQPITIMRNSLGKEEGGSGVALDRDAYEASVKHWDKHAVIISSDPAGE